MDRANAREAPRQRPNPLLRRLYTLSVGTKLILIYIFGIFVPLIAANGLVLRSALRDSREQQRLHVMSSIDAMQAALSRELEPIQLVSSFVFAETPIYRLLGSVYVRFGDFMEAHRDFLVPALTKYANVFAGITRITVYTENRIVGTSIGYLQLDEATRRSDWFRRYEELGGEMVTIFHLDDDPRTEIEPAPYISLFRELDNTAMQRLGRLILRIDINPAALARHAAPRDLVGIIQLVDPTGAVALDSSHGPVPEGAVDFDVPFVGPVPLSGWRFKGSVAPATSLVPPATRWTMLFVVSGLSIAASSLLIMLLSRSVVSRLQMLSAQMRRVEQEDFRPLPAPEHRDDEVDRLITDFNIMARKIESLINDRYKSELERQQLIVAKQQAELDSLQSQVDPHYLFNVLESVRMKSHIRGEHETARVVKQISRSIRRLTSWECDMVPLSDELAFAREYIEIQQYRFGDRLGFDIDSDPALAGIEIPKLTIQGLVENACIHGIEPKPAGGRVSVDISRADTRLTIVVRDDGVGCNEAEIRTQLMNGASVSRHIGIANISRRLSLHFKERAHLEFESRVGRGTTVRITIEGIDGVASGLDR